MSDLLARRRSLPPGGTLEMATMRDGWPVRTLRWNGCESGPGSILFITGRGDFMEKYAETFWDLTETGWNVMSFDWRGQGLSGRQGDAAGKGHSPGFDNWEDDLDALIDVFHAHLPRPWFAVGHSMGGHLLLRHLAGENNEFGRAVLLSPMLGLRGGPVGPGLLRFVARGLTALGRGGRYVIGGGPYVPGTPGSKRQHLLTNDADRYVDEGWWTQQNPALALGSVTWGWLDAAFRSFDLLFAGDSRAALERITTPLLILMSGNDGLVDNAATERAAKRLRSVELETVAPAGHELLRELPPVRQRVLARVTAFLTDGE